MLGPWLLGQATNVIFAGVIGEQIPPGVSKEQAVAALQAQGKNQQADMIASMTLTDGVDFVALGRIIALVIVEWAYYARTVRGTALVERRREYIEAAQCLALPTHRILFRHLLPNCLPPLIVVATMQVARAIALEATLSFLGLGVPITEPSLGLLISNGYEYMLSGKYWISFYPGIALLITIVSINLVGDQLRDVLNPRLKK